MISGSLCCFSGDFSFSLNCVIVLCLFIFIGFWCGLIFVDSRAIVSLLMSAPLVAKVGTAEGRVACHPTFLMGGTGACPLVGGADPCSSGVWGFVSG